MPEYLYRFRSTDKLLGEKYQELERQEIFFASPDRLNDPMEGFIDVYWTGDTIVWKNLLRHYLLCLERLCALLLVSKEHDNFDDSLIPVFDTESILPTDKYKELYQDICYLFFNNKAISGYPVWLARRSQPIRRNELTFHLRQLHTKALSAIYTAYENHKHISDTAAIRQLNALPTLDIESLSQLNKLDHQFPDHKLAEHFYAEMNNIRLQRDIIHHYNNSESPLPQNRTMVLFEFPDKYIKELERIVYPKWYACSFISSCNSSSMWGHYGDGHKGICLKFKATKDNNLPFIQLHGITGWASSINKSGPTLGCKKFQFRKVDYSGKHPAIDFFRSLGCLPMAVLNEWYTDNEGNESISADDIFKNENAWRKRYWDNFYKRIAVKLNDWAYENEYRLILSGMVIDFNEPNRRIFKFNFKDLDAVIFGIKTSQEDKLRIARIIETKCQAEARDDFKFYQSYYSMESGQIETSEMNLLNFKKNKH